MSPVSQQLLAIVQQKAMMGVVDSTLNFALTALWNLTDEIPAAAHNFIKCQGLELYEEVLEVNTQLWLREIFPDVRSRMNILPLPFFSCRRTTVSHPFNRRFSDSWWVSCAKKKKKSHRWMLKVEKSMWGKTLLQNNIAEVEELQEDLLAEELLEHVLTLLQNSRVAVGVRYFAGGILAQLASRAETCSLDEELRATIVKQLVCVVLSSKPLEVVVGHFLMCLLHLCSIPL